MTSVDPVWQFTRRLLRHIQLLLLLLLDAVPRRHFAAPSRYPFAPPLRAAVEDCFLFPVTPSGLQLLHELTMSHRIQDWLHLRRGSRAHAS
jgi:hypothetical protein